MRKALIVVLTLATSCIHLIYFTPDFDGAIMGLNGLGYITLLALLYLPIPATQGYQRLIRRALIGYTAITIVGYFIYGLVTGEWSVPLGPIAKVIEVILIALLWQADQQGDKVTR